MKTAKEFVMYYFAKKQANLQKKSFKKNCSTPLGKRQEKDSLLFKAESWTIFCL